MFRISCFADEISPDINVEVSVMKELGIKYVELRSVGKTNVLDFTDEEITEIKKIFDENGISVSSIGSPIGKVDFDCDFESYLEKFYRAVYLAKFFGTKYIRIFSFFLGERDIDACRDKVMKRLAIMAAIAEKNGVVLCHENEAAIYGQQSDRCLDILQTIGDGSFRAVFDPANFVFAGEHPMDCLKHVHQYVEYVHLKDATFGGVIVPAGEGDGQIAEVLEFLRYHDGMFVSLEPHLAVAGRMKGFSGEELFKVAYNALTKQLDALGIAYT